MHTKTAIVTGAAGGIGSAVARALYERGYGIAALYNKTVPAEEIKALGAAFRCDVTSPDDCLAAVNAAERIAPVELLVNCAGVSLIKPVDAVTDGEYDEVFGVNMRGVFNMTRAAAPLLLRRKRGGIINIASMWGVVGSSCEAVYSASKAAVIGFTKACAKELAPSGITVNCIAPGLIDTKMNAALSADEINELISQTPLGRIGTPQDCARAVVFLAESPFITAQTITVDGGFSA